MTHPPAKAWIEISRSALKHNVRLVQRIVKPSQVMAIVKANAYGHGLSEIASCLRDLDVSLFGVDALDEALALRHMGIDRPVLILGYTPKHRLKEVASHDLSQTVYNLETVKILSQFASKKHPARVHLKIETGLHRQGIELSDLPMFLSAVCRSSNVIIEGVSTHFANVEDTIDSSFATLQMERFAQALSLIQEAGVDPAWKHAACSAAAFLHPEARFNVIRLGISMYGLWSSELIEQVCASRGWKLRPVLSWKTMVAQVKMVAKGEPVSYGLTRRVDRLSRIAVLPVGYADGFDRMSQSNQGEVLIRGKRCPILGRVCMNMCMADVTDVPGVRAEDEVVLIGQQRGQTCPAEDLAALGKTINYETVARLNALIPRVLVK